MRVLSVYRSRQRYSGIYVASVLKIRDDPSRYLLHDPKADC
jgi:hypothetical protein